MIIKHKSFYAEFNGIKTVSWLGTTTSIIGAFLLATGYIVTGYLLFVVGSGCWLLVGYIQKDKALMSLNTAFLVADFLGLWNYY